MSKRKKTTWGIMGNPARLTIAKIEGDREALAEFRTVQGRLGGYWSHDFKTEKAAQKVINDIEGGPDWLVTYCEVRA